MLAVFGSVTVALQHARRDDGAAARREHRVALVRRAPTGALLFLGPIEAWLQALIHLGRAC